MLLELAQWLAKDFRIFAVFNYITLRAVLATLTALAIGLVFGPALIRLGSEEQKKLFLPRIAKGEIIFAIGYTEPTAGTACLASVLPIEATSSPLRRGPGEQWGSDRFCLRPHG